MALSFSVVAAPSAHAATTDNTALQAFGANSTVNLGNSAAGAASNANSAYGATAVDANSLNAGTTYAPGTGTVAGNAAINAGNAGAIQPLTTTDVPVAQSNNAPSSANPINTKNDIGCTSGQVDMCLSNVVEWLAVSIPSYFLYVGAMFFGATVHMSLDSAAYALTFISTGWSVARDLANMLFLFILVFIAFKIMLNSETGGDMSTLAGVVLIALIVNFSFFGTRLFIDAGNVVSTQLYNAIPGSATQDNSILSGMKAKDLSASIMSTLNVQSLTNSDEFNKWNSDTNASHFSLTRLITLSVLYISIGAISVTLALSLFMAGIHFLGRIVFLWLAIIVSPLALVAWTLGETKGYFSKWFTMLMKNTFYPAAFLFVYLLLTVFLQTLSGTGKTLAQGMFGQMAQSSSSTNAGFLFQLGSAVAYLVITLGIVLIMIQQAMRAGESFGTSTAGWAKSFGGFLNRQVVSRYSRGFAQASGVPVGRPGPSALSLATGVASKRVGPGLLASKIDTSLRTGAMAPLGNTAIGREFRRYVTEPIVQSKVGGAESRAELETRRGKEASERAKNLQTVADKELLQRVVATAAAPTPAPIPPTGSRPGVNVPVAAPAAPAPLAPEDKKRVADMPVETIIENLKPSDIKKIAPLLGDAKIKALEESTNAKLSAQDKKDFRAAWHEGASDAPQQETNRSLKEARDVATRLGTTIDGVNDVLKTLVDGATINAEALRRVTASLNIARDDIKAQQKKTNDDLAETKKAYEAGRVSQTVYDLAKQHARSTLRELTPKVSEVQDAIDSLKQAGKSLSKVPASGEGAARSHNKEEVIMTA